MSALLERFRALKSGLQAPQPVEEADSSGGLQEASAEEIWEYRPDEGHEAATPYAQPAEAPSLDERLRAAFQDIVAEPYDSSWTWEEAQQEPEEAQPEQEEVDGEAEMEDEEVVLEEEEPEASSSVPHPKEMAFIPAALRSSLPRTAAFRPAPKAGMQSAAAQPSRPSPISNDAALDPDEEYDPELPPEAEPRSETVDLTDGGIATPMPKTTVPMVPLKAKLGGAPGPASTAATGPGLTRGAYASAYVPVAPSHAGGVKERNGQKAPSTPPKRSTGNQPRILAKASKASQAFAPAPKGLAPVPKERQMAPKAAPKEAPKAKPVYMLKPIAKAQAAQAAAKATAAEEDGEQEKTADDPEAEAEQRLDKNKVTAQGWELIRLLKEEFRLSAQVELGLKLLDPLKLWQVLGRNGQSLRIRLKMATDKDKTARAIVAASDPSADDLVKRLLQKEEMGHEEEEEEESPEEKAVVEGRMAATQAAELADILAKEAAAPTPAPKAQQRVAREHRTASRWLRGRTQPPQRSRSRRPKALRPPEPEPPRRERSVLPRSAAPRDRRPSGAGGRARSRSRTRIPRRREESRREEEVPRRGRERELPPRARLVERTSVRRPRGSAGHSEKGGGEVDELGQWLSSLDDHGGALLRYAPALRHEFTSLSQLTAAFSPPPPGSSKPYLACVEPSLFQALGMQLLGHKLLIAKGIAALCGHKKRSPVRR